MTQLALTALVPLFMVAAFLWKALKTSVDNPQFMNKNFTDTLKGLCAIIVVMVHFRPEYQNSLQDAMGGFAYVAVTFFFLFSAYGMQWSLANKPGYLKHFWRGRLVGLLLPAVLINVAFFIIQSLYHGELQFATLLYANDYVVVLLEYCLLFYVVMKFCEIRAISNLRYAYLFMAAIVVVSSLLLYFLTVYVDGRHGTNWCFERYGLIYGLGLFAFFPAVKKWTGHSTLPKLIVAGIVSAVLGLLYVKGYKNMYFWGEYVLKIALGLSMVVTVLLLTRRLQIGNKITSFLGSISYEIYLSHGWVMYLLAHYFPEMRSGEFIIATYFVTIMFSFAIHKAVKALRPFLLRQKLSLR